jgi:hypothetical protein
MRLFIKERFAEIVDQQELTLSTKKDKSHPFIPLFKDLLSKQPNVSFISTNYDFIIEKILHQLNMDITINRGEIDTAKFNKKQWHEAKVSLYKLNGGFDDLVQAI